jgi:hypothetical protein
MARVTVDDATVAGVLADVRAEITRRIGEKGNLSFASRHECLGELREEFHELEEEIIANDPDAFKHELFDIIVAAVWSICSQKVDGLDW